MKKTKYSQLSARTRNALTARLDNAIAKYGFDEFRIVAQHLITKTTASKKLVKEIARKEAELKRLKEKR